MPTPGDAVDIAARFGLDGSAPELAERKAVATRDFLAARSCPLMPGAREVLAHLQCAGLRLAVVTGAARDATLAADGLLGHFEAVVVADDSIRRKPVSRATLPPPTPPTTLSRRGCPSATRMKWSRRP